MTCLPSLCIHLHISLTFYLAFSYWFMLFSQVGWTAAQQQPLKNHTCMESIWISSKPIKWILITLISHAFQSKFLQFSNLLTYISVPDFNVKTSFVVLLCHEQDKSIYFYLRQDLNSFYLLITCQTELSFGSLVTLYPQIPLYSEYLSIFSYLPGTLHTFPSLRWWVSHVTLKWMFRWLCLFE